MNSFISGVRLLADQDEVVAFYLEGYDNEVSVHGKQELIKEIHNYIKEMGLEDELNNLR